MGVDLPLRAADGRDLTFLSAGEGILAGMYLESLWPAVVAGLTEPQAGRPELPAAGAGTRVSR